MSRQTSSTASTPSQPGRETGYFLFSVTANTQPGIVERILAPMTKLALVPSSVHLTQDIDVSISLSVDGLTENQANHISERLGQIPGIIRVHHQMVKIPHRPSIERAA